MITTCNITIFNLQVMHWKQFLCDEQIQTILKQNYMSTLYNLDIYP